MFGYRAGALKLWGVAILVAVTLCGAEVNYRGRRDVLAHDQMNHLVLTASMAEGFLEGTFPPRVSPMLSGGLGNPYHQFYSPLSHMYSAAASLLMGDTMTGFSLCTVFILALAFVYAFRLGRYLTLSNHCAAAAAFLFVTAPYLSTDRVLRGAFAEYVAFCLLPMALYYNLRALPFRSFKAWAKATVSTAALLLTHLITGFFFLLFYAVFLILSGLSLLIRHYGRGGTEGTGVQPGPCPKLWPFIRKAFAAMTIAVFATLLGMYCLGPVLFYSDLVMKRDVLANTAISVSGAVTPILSLFSLTDTSWNYESHLMVHSRFQAGFALLASYGAFVYFLARRRTAWAFPFALTAGLVLVTVTKPEVFLYPPLKYVDIAQFSYRFLSLFTLSAACAGALALRALFRSSGGFAPASRTAAAMAVIALSLTLAVPYLYPRPVQQSRLGLNLYSSIIFERSRLFYGENAYLRVPPAEASAEWTDPGRVSVGWRGKPGDWIFLAELEDYYRVSGGPPGEVLLDVLYYPGLQHIEILADGKPLEVQLGTWWQRRDTVRGAFETETGGFHGLKITGAPEKGFLKVKVRFTGYSWANWISLATIAFLLGGTALSVWRGRGRRSNCLKVKRSRSAANPVPAETTA
jgi:hypothetical protein